MKKELIAAFDFDGTITSRDTFFSFLKFTNTRASLATGFLVLAPVLVLYKIGILPNYRAKQIVFTWFYKGCHIDWFNSKCAAFAAEIEKIIRPAARQSIQQYKSSNATVVVISASVENWLQPWCKANGVDVVIGTTIQVDAAGMITGKFLSKNCYGAEKVNRLLEIYPNRESYVLDAYGDSKGDRELIRFADCGCMNKF